VQLQPTDHRWQEEIDTGTGPTGDSLQDYMHVGRTVKRLDSNAVLWKTHRTWDASIYPRPSKVTSFRKITFSEPFIVIHVREKNKKEKQIYYLYQKTHF